LRAIQFSRTEGSAPLSRPHPLFCLFPVSGAATLASRPCRCQQLCFRCLRFIRLQGLNRRAFQSVGFRLADSFQRPLLRGSRYLSQLFVPVNLFVLPLFFFASSPSCCLWCCLRSMKRRLEVGGNGLAERTGVATHSVVARPTLRRITSSEAFHQPDQKVTQD